MDEVEFPWPKGASCHDGLKLPSDFDEEEIIDALFPISIWKWTWTTIETKLNFLHATMFYVTFNWNWSCDFGEEDVLKFTMSFYYLSISFLGKWPDL